MLIDPYRFGGRDPHFANVSFLMDLNQPVGSTTFTDIANPSRVISTNLVSYSDVNQNNGENTLRFNGGGNFLSAVTSDAVAFGVNPYTVEFVLRVDSLQTGYRVVMDNRISYAGVDTITINIGDIPQPTPVDTYFRFSMVYDGARNKFYVNDDVVFDATSGTASKVASPILLGRFYDNPAGIKMNLAKVRFTKGVARTPSEFIPISGPIPLSA